MIKNLQEKDYVYVPGGENQEAVSNLINNLEYKCVCSEDRFISGIQLLGMDEIIDIKKDKTIECTCNFCKKVYKIDTTKI